MQGVGRTSKKVLVREHFFPTVEEQQRKEGARYNGQDEGEYPRPHGNFPLGLVTTGLRVSINGRLSNAVTLNFHRSLQPFLNNSQRGFPFPPASRAVW